MQLNESYQLSEQVDSSNNLQSETIIPNKGARWFKRQRSWLIFRLVLGSNLGRRLITLRFRVLSQFLETTVEITVRWPFAPDFLDSTRNKKCPGLILSHILSHFTFFFFNLFRLPDSILQNSDFLGSCKSLSRRGGDADSIAHWKVNSKGVRYNYKQHDCNVCNILLFNTFPLHKQAK